MAPTICAEKESATRDRFRKNRIGQQHNNHHHYNHHQLNGVFNGGKITHRRSISSRNALSKLTSLRVPDSESSNDTDSQSIRSMDDEITNKMNENSSRTVMMQIDDDEDSSSLSDRLSISKETFSVFRNVKHHNYLHNRNNEIGTTTKLPSNSSFIELQDDTTISSSSYSTSTTSLSALDLDQVIATVSKFPQRKGSTKKLLEIAVKTIKLIKRNQLLQKKLAQLQFETRVFIESVMANPENQALRHKIETSNQKIET